MAFPQTPLPIRKELYINGSWVDITSPTNYVDGATGVNINRGRADQQSNLSASTESFTMIKDSTGIFNNLNPNSAYYGYVGLGTPTRTVVTPTNAYLRLPHINGGSYASTSDKAALDVIGDIDIRADITPDSWRPPLARVLMGKWVTTGNQRSYSVVMTEQGLIRLYWSNDGSTINSTTSTIAVPVTTAGRLAVRVTLDVVSGVNKVATFYTSDTINGTWTQLGLANTTAGTTSIFASTAGVELGSGNNGTGVFTNTTTFYGKMHALEVRDGIGGTVVANPIFTDDILDATNDIDSSGNTWTLFGNARIGSDQARFWGRLTTIPMSWDATKRDVRTSYAASGLFNRLLRDASLNSPIYRNFIQYSTLAGYWPLEDASGATRASAARGNAGIIQGTVTFQGESTLPGSDGAVVLADGNSKLRLGGAVVAVTGTAVLTFYFRCAALPAGDTILLSANTTSGQQYRVYVGAATYRFDVVNNSDGSVVDTASAAFGTGASPLNQWIGMQITLRTSGANVNWINSWHGVGTSTFYTTNVGGKLYAGSVGRFNSVSISPGSAIANTAFAHVSLMTGQPESLVSTNFANISNAWIGETAAARIIRLMGEEGYVVDNYGETASTEAMGAQTITQLLTLLQECQQVDGGVLTELRDAEGAVYKSRVYLEGRSAVTLSHTLSHLAVTPVVQTDDRGILNSVEVSRPGGGSATSVVTEGALSTAAPPLGVGRYGGSRSFNTRTDDRLESLAGLATLFGTWNEPRVPNLTVGLHRSELVNNATLTSSVITLDVGSRIILTGLPSFVAPDDLGLLVYGYTERLLNQMWTIIYNTGPSGPYNTGLLNDAATTDAYTPRLDATVSFLKNAITTTATSLVIATPTANRPWVNSVSNPTEFPFDIKVLGERITITALTAGSVVGANQEQTATVTRSVNGIIKAHSANEPVFIFQPAYLGM